LHAAGGRSEAFLPLLWRHRPFTLNLRNHRKLVIVDGRVAFVGGRNIGDEYALDRFGKSCKWFDVMMRVEGPAVARMHRVFVEDWYTAAEEDIARPEYFPDVPPAGNEIAGLVDSGPDARSHHLHWVFFQLLTMAQRSVRVSSPYLIPHPTILTAMKIAAARGVRVEVHTNGRAAEATVLYHAKRWFYRELIAAGVEVVETAGDYNHGKMIIIDDEILLVGSPNLDMRSEELNFEIALIARESPACAAAVALFEERCRQGAVVTAAELRTGRFAQVVEGMCRLVSPLL
jgi:cardiolipin synthase